MKFQKTSDSKKTREIEVIEEMAVVRTHFENNNEVGVFSKLTNAYCLIGIGRSANFFATFESELDEVVPVVYSTIGGCRIVGRMTVGKK